MKESKQRNSSIELMKIIALFLVVLCHSLPLYKLGGSTELDGFLNLRQSTSNLQQLVLIIFSHLGQVGNALFIVPSVYYLLDSNEVKKNKIIQYIMDTLIISVIYLVIFSVIHGKLPITFIVSSLLPITFNFYWFITCYILLYAIHPWLNIIIKNLEKKQLFVADICMFFLYCVVSFALDGKYYYSHLIGFIVYYFFVAYVKLYLPKLSSDKKVNLKVFAVSLCGFILMIVGINCLGGHFSFVSRMVGDIERFINPFIVGLSISTFNLCRLKIWRSEKINIISSTSLLVFVISNNNIICSFVKPILFKNIYVYVSYNYIAAICVLIAIATMVISVIIALVYMKTIQRLVNLCVPKIINICIFLSKKIYSYIVSIENNSRGGVQTLCKDYSVYLFVM